MFEVSRLLLPTQGSLYAICRLKSILKPVDEKYRDDVNLTKTDETP